RVVQRAIVDDSLTVSDVDAKVDLDRLRRGPLVRQDADERVKAHSAQRDLDHVGRRYAASIAARSDAVSWRAASTLSPAARTIALPTTTPSAIRATAAACSGPETPNPTHTGSVDSSRRRCTISGSSLERLSRIPVTP